MKFARRRSRRAVAGIVATVIMFAILFTVGTSYFIFVNSENQSYVQSLVKATSKEQGSLTESLTVNTVLEADGEVGFTATDTSGVTVNMTAVLVISSTGALLTCAGVGFPAGAGCTNTTPTLWITIDSGATSASIDTGSVYSPGSTVTVKVLTARGNSYSQTYPEAASQSGSSQSVTVALDNLKWVQLLPQASSYSHKNYVANCATQVCNLSFGANVAAGDVLVEGASWVNQATAPTVTDSQNDQIIAGTPETSVTSASSPAEVRDGYAQNCNAATCGLTFSSETAGDTLVYAVGWANGPSAPTSVQDTRGATWHSGESSSVTVNPTISLVQHLFSSNGCSSSTCSLAFTNPPATGNTLVFGLGWPSTQQYSYVPVTITNCQLLTTIAIDGSTTAGSGGSATNSQTTGTLTTTNANDVIIVIASLSDGSGGSSSSNHVTSVTGTGLTFHARQSATDYVNPTYYADVEEWYATTSSTFSNTITVQTSGTFRFTVIAFGVSGANTGSPFDANGSANPTASGISNSPSVTQSTSNANDMILTGLAVSQTPGTVNTFPSGFTNTADVLTAGTTSQAEGVSDYDIVSATRSSSATSYALSSSTNSWVMLADAIQQGTGCSSSAISVDGSNDNECDTASSCAVSITTTHTNDLVYMSVSDSAGGLSVSSVSDTAGLSWNLRQSIISGGNGYDIWTYYAVSANVLNSDSVTVNLSGGSGNMRMAVIGAAGVNLSAPFDPNLSTAPTNTGTTATPTVTFTTTNANDLIIGTTKDSTSTLTAGAAGYTALLCCTSVYFGFEYKVVSATGSNTPSFTASGGTAWGEIGDALEAAPSTATPTNFQLMLKWDPATYTAYEATNLGNVRFCVDSACATPLDSWLESCSSTCSTSGSTSTSATAWVNLAGHTIAGNGGTITIYMVFEATNVNFDDNYWGEAPQLSGTYAQYDNGANVFSFYDNFAGSTLSASNWQTVLYGGGTISVNNGLTISTSTNTYNPMLVSKNTYSPQVEDSDMSLNPEQTASSTPGIFYATVLPATSGGDYGFKTAYRFDWSEGTGLFRILDDISGTYSGGTTVAHTLPSTYNVWSATWSATGSESLAFNYSPQLVWTNSGITYGSSYIGTAAVQGGQAQRAVDPTQSGPAQQRHALDLVGEPHRGHGLAHLRPRLARRHIHAGNRPVSHGRVRPPTSRPSGTRPRATLAAAPTR